MQKLLDAKVIILCTLVPFLQLIFKKFVPRNNKQRKDSLSI